MCCQLAAVADVMVVIAVVAGQWHCCLCQHFGLGILNANGAAVRAEQVLALQLLHGLGGAGCIVELNESHGMLLLLLLLASVAAVAVVAVAASTAIAAVVVVVGCSIAVCSCCRWSCWRCRCRSWSWSWSWRSQS